MTLRPQGTILTWVLTDPTNKIGQAQQSSIIKGKWYIQDQARPGPQGVSGVHEQVVSLPEGTEHPVGDVLAPPLATCRPPLEEVLVQSLAFTNGSAKLKAVVVHWAAMAIHHMDGHLLMET